MNTSPSVSELIVEGYGEEGFRAEHALAVALADAAPALKIACQNARAFISSLPDSPDKGALLKELEAALHAASTHVSRNAS